jgi:polyhydroxybutyrate depolymerase
MIRIEAPTLLDLPRFRRCAAILSILSCAAIDSSTAISAAPGQTTRALPAGDHSFTLTHGGRRRSYLVHAPRQGRVRQSSGAGSEGARPVVLAFHGGGGEAEGFKGYAGLDAVADREGFIVVYPSGSGVLPRRLLTWNAGECCGYAMNRRIDDVGFAVAVLDDLARRTAIDAQRVYATGHSNGAMMAYRLGAERADRIAAIVPVAGGISQERFTPDRRVAVLAIHSVDDPRALYEGGLGPPFPGTDVRSSHRPAMEGLEKWRRHNGCAATTRVSDKRAGRSGTTAQTATLLEWNGCGAGAPVAHWKLTGVGHLWPGAPSRGRDEISGTPTTLINAAEEIWRFVSRVNSRP